MTLQVAKNSSFLDYFKLPDVKNTSFLEYFGLQDAKNISFLDYFGLQETENTSFLDYFGLLYSGLGYRVCVFSSILAAILHFWSILAQKGPRAPRAPVRLWSDSLLTS